MFLFTIQLIISLFPNLQNLRKTDKQFINFSQAAVYSLLYAASEISSRGDSRDRNVNVFVQRR